MNEQLTYHPPRAKEASIAMTILATSLGFVLVQLDVTIVNVALARIGDGLRMATSGLQWVVDAYALAFASLLLPAGALADRFGARRMFATGLVGFMVSSIACAAATTGSMLIVARGVQGAAAAWLVPCSLALLNHACGDDDARRARAIGLWTSAGGAAVAAGPVIGGLLVESLGWRSIFFVNVPVCILAIWLVLRRTPETRLQERKRNFDAAGQTLAIVALLALTAAVIEAGTRGWGSGIVLDGLGVALVTGAGFLFVESRTREPMLPLFFFRRPAFSAASAVGLLVNFAFYGVVFVLSLYFQHERGFSAAQTGFAFLPLTAVVTISNIAAGSFAARLGPRLPMVVGLVIGALGFGLLSRLSPDSGYASMIPGLILIPLGIGLAVPPMTSALLSTVDRQHSGVASGVLNTVRQAGGAIGVALFGALTAQAGARIEISYVISAACLLAAAAIAAIGIQTPAREPDA